MNNHPIWTAAEYDILAVSEEVSTAQWAAKHRMLTQGPIIGPEGDPVPWRNDTFPLQVAVMDAADDEGNSRVVVMGPPQAGGKTDIEINILLRAIHPARRDVIYVSANFSKAVDQSTKKIEPAIRASDVAWLLPC